MKFSKVRIRVEAKGCSPHETTLKDFVRSLPKACVDEAFVEWIANGEAGDVDWPLPGVLVTRL